jgi:Lar family restriction alleviation protein
MKKLKPCPFCGGEATITEDGERIGTNRQSCMIVCFNCGARLESNEEYEQCGEQWNTRFEIQKDGEL